MVLKKYFKKRSECYNQLNLDRTTLTKIRHLLPHSIEKVEFFINVITVGVDFDKKELNYLGETPREVMKHTLEQQQQW